MAVFSKSENPPLAQISLYRVPLSSHLGCRKTAPSFAKVGWAVAKKLKGVRTLLMVLVSVASQGSY